MSQVLILPLESTSPGLEGRLGALCALPCDGNLDTENFLIKLNRLPERILPHPGYLFAQGLNPNLFLKAPCEASFFKDCVELLNSFDTIITYSSRPLQTLEITALRLCQDLTFPRPNQTIIEVSTLLHAIEIFNGIKLNLKNNLINTAKSLGYKEELSKAKQKEKLLALNFCLNKAKEISPSLFAFLNRPLSYRFNLLTKALNEKNGLVCVDRLGKLTLIIPLKITGLYVECIVFGENIVYRDEFNFTQGYLIAPLSVLTKERQDAIEIDPTRAMEMLHFWMEKLEQLDDYRVCRPSQKFFSKLNDQDLEYFKLLIKEECGKHPKAPLGLSLFFKRHLLMLLGDNFRKDLSEEELLNYIDLCNKNAETKLNNYSKAINDLVPLVQDGNDEDLKLIEALTYYPSNLSAQ